MKKLRYHVPPYSQQSPWWTVILQVDLFRQGPEKLNIKDKTIKHEARKNTVYLIITVVKDKTAAISLYSVFVSDKPLNVLICYSYWTSLIVFHDLCT